MSFATISLYDYLFWTDNFLMFQPDQINP